MRLTARFGREKFENPDLPRNRIRQEIELLRAKLADMESLELELSKAELALASTGNEPAAATADQIQSEIKKRLSFIPLYFVPATDFPDILLDLWRQSRIGYYDNPLPDKFKEKLFVLLARYCSSPYSVVTHSCNLYGMGMTAAGVLQLLQKPLPQLEADARDLPGALAGNLHPLAVWPEEESELEEALLGCCILFFLKHPGTTACQSELRRVLTAKDYAYLVGFLAYVKTFHTWLEAHPEVSYHSDPQVRTHILTLLRDEP